MMKFNEKYGNLMNIYGNLMKKCKKKWKNGLKWVQFSPIWTKLCQSFSNMIIQILSKPEGHHYPNKEVNEDFFLKKKRFFL